MVEDSMMWEVNVEGSSAIGHRGRVTFGRRSEDRGVARRAFVAELVPARTQAGRIELQLRLSSHFGASTRARWAVEVLNEEDVPAGATALEAPVVLGGLGGTYTATISTPAALADGFYVVRVTAVARAGELSDAVVLERWVEVRGGDITAIDVDHYDSRSRPALVG